MKKMLYYVIRLRYEHPVSLNAQSAWRKHRFNNE